MKIGDLASALLVGHTRYAKWRVLQDLANTLGTALGVGEKMLEKICVDGKMHIDTKHAFMNNWDAREPGVLSYLNDLIQDVHRVADALGLPASDDYDKSLLCKAVRFQFAAFFDDVAGTDVDNHIPDIYQKLLENPDAAPIIGGALYPGDAAYDYTKCKHHQMDVYGSLQYEMELQNTGKIPWVNRAMIFEGRNAKIRPGAEKVQIPETRPNGIVKLQFTLSGRGAEGTTHMCWKMVDANDNDCFPKEPDKFYMEIITTFLPND